MNGKCYVGSASCLGGRRKAHEYRLAAGNHHSVKLQRAWNKYGPDSFEFEIIEHVPDKDLLIEREQHWIDYYDASANGYNVAAVAGRTEGVRWSEDRKRRQSERLKGVPQSEAHRAAISASLKGRKHSDETKRKISDAYQDRLKDPEFVKRMGVHNIGRKPTEEVRAKMSLSQKVRWANPEMREHMRNASTGRRHSDETKGKIAESNRRRVYSAETLKKMSDSAKATAARKRAEKQAGENANG